MLILLVSVSTIHSSPNHRERDAAISLPIREYFLFSFLFCVCFAKSWRSCTPESRLILPCQKGEKELNNAQELYLAVSQLGGIRQQEFWVELFVCMSASGGGGGVGWCGVLLLLLLSLLFLLLLFFYLLVLVVFFWNTSIRQTYYRGKERNVRVVTALKI